MVYSFTYKLNDTATNCHLLGKKKGGQANGTRDESNPGLQPQGDNPPYGADK
jgi:hypothetical protein